MGYKVKCYPKDKPAGMLGLGQVGPPWSTGTYYPHPSAANVAAERWVAKNPGGYARVLTWKDEALVSEVHDVTR